VAQSVVAATWASKPDRRQFSSSRDDDCNWPFASCACQQQMSVCVCVYQDRSSTICFGLLFSVDPNNRPCRNQTWVSLCCCCKGQSLRAHKVVRHFERLHSFPESNTGHML
jgi:hypothetical protein